MRFNTIEKYFQYFQSLSVEDQFRFCEHRHPDIIGETGVASMIHYHDCSIEDYDKQVGAVTPEQLLSDICQDKTLQINAKNTNHK